MSKATKRKYVTKEVLDEFVVPAGDEQVAKVVAGRGNNLHEVEDSNGEKYLVSMPTKFRKNIWIKRGDFIIIKPIEEGDKVKAEIVRILYKEQIKYIKENNQWPQRFTAEEKGNSDEMIPSDMLPPSDSESDEDSFVSPNRPLVGNVESNNEEESSEDN